MITKLLPLLQKKWGLLEEYSDMNIAQKCTFCAHLLDDGWKEPRCVDACPTEALRFGEEKDLKEWIDKAEVLHPEYNAKPRVYYIGLPDKYFVAGAVHDPEADECLERATVTLIDSNGKNSQLVTDDFGDFWFEKQEPGTYSRNIEMEGYLSRKIENIDATKDINVGDLKLYKKK